MADEKTGCMQFIQLQPPPYWKHYHPNAMFWHSPIDNKAYLIFVLDKNDNKQIIKYDIQNDKFIELTAYPNTLDIQKHGAIIDILTNTLYIYGGNNNSFGKLNLITNHWTICKEDSNQYWSRYSFPDTVFVYNGLNEIHFIAHNTHYTLKVLKMSYDKVLHDNVTIMPHPINSGGGVSEIVCINDVKLYSFGHDSVRSYDLCPPKESRYCKIKLPTLMSFRCIVALNWIVLILNLGEQKIYFADFGDDEAYIRWGSKSLKSMVDNTQSKGFAFFTITNNHIIHFGVSDLDNKNFHIAINLREIIPNDLYHKYTTKLLYGYVRENYSQYIQYKIPDSIMGLIVKFYV